jgi:hypothetical protein
VSQAHWHDVGSKVKPGAQVALTSHVHAQAAVSQWLLLEHPPQSCLHSTSQVAKLHRSGETGASAKPQLAGQRQSQMLGSHSKFGPGRVARFGCEVHSYWQVLWLHK